MPENYDRYLGPVLFEPFAMDMAARLKGERPQERSGISVRHRHSHASAAQQSRSSRATYRNRSQPRDACVCAGEIRRN
jgi:hypothetical protein